MSASPVFSTPDLCDAFPEQVRVLESAFNNYGAHQRFYGQVVTVCCFEDNSRVKELASQPGKGRVMVVDGGGSLRKALMGDLIAESAVQQGWAGVVINGCVRDVEKLVCLPLGIKALAATPMKTDRKGAGQTDVPITIGGIEIASGEYLYADMNGVIIAPQNLL